MLQAKIINKINFPEISLQSTLEEIAQKIIIPDMQAGIHGRMAINEGSLPKNEKATIKRKGDDRPLIETGKLMCSFFFKPSGKNRVIISIKGDRKEIGGYLQNDGIKTKSKIKFYRFFGISKDAADKAIAYAKKKIEELTSGRNK